MSIHRDKVVVTVTMTWQDDEPIDHAEVFKLVKQYLESPEAPFRDDYASGYEDEGAPPKGWGGYEGPFIVDVQVEEKR